MTDPGLSRRRFLGASAGAAGFAGVSEGGAAQVSRNTRRLVIPRADIFEDNYAGQFVFVDESVGDAGGEVPSESCELDGWPPEEIRVYEGQLLDRRQEAPVAVDLNLYEDASATRIRPSSHFIVDHTVPCSGDYVGLFTRWVPRRALAGKPPGPTVTPTDGADGGAPGFGPLQAGLGLGAWLFLRAVRRRLG